MRRLLNCDLDGEGFAYQELHQERADSRRVFGVLNAKGAMFSFIVVLREDGQEVVALNRAGSIA